MRLRSPPHYFPEADLKSWLTSLEMYVKQTKIPEEQMDICKLLPLLKLMMPETFKQSTNKSEQPLPITMLWQRVYALSMLVGNGSNYYCLPV